METLKEHSSAELFCGFGRTFRAFTITMFSSGLWDKLLPVGWYKNLLMSEERSLSLISISETRSTWRDEYIDVNG